MLTLTGIEILGQYINPSYKDMSLIKIAFLTLVLSPFSRKRFSISIKGRKFDNKAIEKILSLVELRKAEPFSEISWGNRCKST